MSEWSKCMKKSIIIIVLILLLVSFLYFYLAIELELKYVIEQHGIKIGQLIDSSFRIRTYAQIQIMIFIVLFIINILLLNKAFKRDKN